MRRTDRAETGYGLELRTRSGPNERLHDGGRHYRSPHGYRPVTQPDNRLDANSVLQDGDFDSTALLVLWCLKKAFFPLLWIGLIVAVLLTQDAADLGEEIQAEIENLDTPGEFLSALVSPFAGVLIALVLRIAVGVAAFALAYPLARWNRPSDYARRGSEGSHLRLWWDRVYMTRSYRSLRWSWAVRQEAADRLGRRGRVLELCNPILTSANVLLFIVLVVVFTIAS